MKEYIYVLRLVPALRTPSNWTDREKQVVADHYRHLVQLHNNDVVILAGKTDYEIDNAGNFGIVIFKAASPEAAREIMNSDPALANGVMTAELHPYSLAVGP
jgi:uncharacterized protein YciI